MTEDTSATHSAFPLTPEPGRAWFDSDPKVGSRARELLDHARAEWERMQSTKDKSYWVLLISQTLLLALSVLSAALGAAPGVPGWVRAGVAALITAVVAFLGIFGFAKAWDAKRTSATKLSLEAFAFINQLADYKEPASAEEATQTFFTKFETIRIESQLTHTARD